MRAFHLSRPWLVLLGLALSVAISNGFGRFSYGLILPAMRESLHWSYTQAGWLNTANAIGYLAGAVATMALIRRVTPGRLFVIGTLGTAISLALTGVDESLAAQSLCRMGAGVFGALSFICGGTLAASMFTDSPRQNALAIALYFGGGGGLGLALCGAVLPVMLDVMGPQSWDTAWFLVGFAALAFVPVTIWAAAHVKPPIAEDAPRSKPPLRRMLRQMISYGFFGLGYIVYPTFLSAWMVSHQISTGLIAATWVALGVSVMASPFLWRGLLARFASGLPMAVILVAVAAGSALPVLLPNTVGLLLSALVFGLSFFMPPSAITSFVRQNLPQPDWGAAISVCTVVFAVSQILGPIGAGWIGDHTGQIGDGLLVASAMLLAGAACAVVQRPLGTG
ncbi:YbfB/YjiJ family MFS transporter [Ruegeria jejuensis]|uniref:YbfB/YjiJ family MFS transporter n=1 Tax=Ruegeria jejuensis TaxID=3233338 RepID=UPI00355B9CCD